jgi:predicted lipoprotein with Yx(FWY)xxD motif
MNKTFAVFSFVAMAALAACGGGGTSMSGGNPVPSPLPSNTAPPQGNLAAQETVGGSAAWVDPASHKTLYYLDVDTATGGTCVAGCISIWPPFVPTSGSSPSGNMTIVTRSDGTGQQWAYQSHPLYTYTGDTGGDENHGDDIPGFGGHWHVARPAAIATPPPGGTPPPPCNGPYC